MPSDPADVEVQTSNNENPPRISFQNDPPTEEDDDGDGDVDETTPSLHQSPRLKGYITLFVSALYNYFAASGKFDRDGGKLSKTCLYLDYWAELGGQNTYTNTRRLRFAMACSTITMIISSGIILVHFDFCTPLRKTWPKWFGSQDKGKSRVELCILLFLTLFWFIAVWFTTSIRGPAGAGQDEHNLYFSSWICCWATFWTLERYSTSKGRASFEKFVRSWPNRCPAWILTLILSLADFLFALDAYRNWAEGTKNSPYEYELFSSVPHSEWVFLLFTTCATFTVSFCWVLAEIFRENRTNVESVKSDVEEYVEGLTLQVVTVIWIVTVFVTTMPGGSASLIGNLYFTTWSTTFAVIGTLIWWVRDFRQGILDVILEQQDEYEQVKQTIRRREERRRARLAEEAEGIATEDQQLDVKSTETNTEESNDDDIILCEDDPDADDDITLISGSNTGHNRSRLNTGVSSITPSPDRDNGIGASSDDMGPAESVLLSASRSLFVSALSFFYDPETDEQGEGNSPNVH